MISKNKNCRKFFVIAVISGKRVLPNVIIKPLYTYKPYVNFPRNSVKVKKIFLLPEDGKFAMVKRITEAMVKENQILNNHSKCGLLKEIREKVHPSKAAGTR